MSAIHFAGVPATRGARGRTAALILLVASLFPAPASAKKHPPFEAQAGVDIARAGAKAWSHDAVLIYVENDEPLDNGGSASRWGYLFYSEYLRKARAYSIREGEILVAENLEMKLEAPPLAESWIDSGVARRAADQAAGLQFCREFDGKIQTMALIRGALSDKDPDQTTWMVVYRSRRAPSLFVVVDAKSGSVIRTWRG
jgi:hypothetical protein